MGKQDTQKFKIPDSPVTVWYHIATYGDDMTARRLSRGSAEPKDQAEDFILARMAACLEKSKGMARNKKADEFPSDADMEARLAWVKRLPPAWAMSLASQISEESDLDPEDE